MKRVLFSCGNAPGLPTGYGGQGMLALRAFLNANMHVTVLAWNLSPMQFTPFQEYTTEDVVRMNPQMAQIVKHDVNWASVRWMCNPYAQFPSPILKKDLNRMIVDTSSDFFVALQDIFMFEPGPFTCLSAVWMPLHFTPVEHPTVMSLADFDIQLPISGWGATLLSTLQDAKSTRHVEVVAHGRDTSVFCPGPSSRKDLGWPEDAFVCLMVASNSEESGRKAFDAQIQAFAHFLKANDKAWLHIHAEIVRAYDIPRLLEIFGLLDRSPFIDWNDHRKRSRPDAIVLGPRVSMSPPTSLNKTSDENMANMYRAANVLLAATCSEGCGVPVLEAQLCGTPVVTTRTTAMWEETMLGASVPSQQWIARNDFNSGWWLPDSKGVADAILQISKWTAEEKAALVEKHMPRLKKEFSNEAILAQWAAVLEKCKTPETILSKERLALLRVSKLLRTSAILNKTWSEELNASLSHLASMQNQKTILDYTRELV